jgi:hypothetical protein
MICEGVKILLQHLRPDDWTERRIGFVASPNRLTLGPFSHISTLDTRQYSTFHSSLSKQAYRPFSSPSTSHCEGDEGSAAPAISSPSGSLHNSPTRQSLPSPPNPPSQPPNPPSQPPHPYPIYPHILCIPSPSTSSPQPRPSTACAGSSRAQSCRARR